MSRRYLTWWQEEFWIELANILNNNVDINNNVILKVKVEWWIMLKFFLKKFEMCFINMDFLLSGMAHHLIWCNMESEFHQ